MTTPIAFSLGRARLLAIACVLVATHVVAADPLLDSWQVTNSRRYARVFETSADITAGSTVTTWPRSGLVNMGGGQATPTYSDVQRVSFSASYVYINATGLASYTMGPWYLNAAKTAPFPNWPTGAGVLMRFPRTPVIAAVKTSTRLGPIALGVNGVVLFNAADAFSYNGASGQDTNNGNGYWNRDALPNEGPTFDATGAHQPGNGQYHYHVNPIALRFQLGDHVVYNATTNTYSESSAAPSHSPILGWAFDGYPIYGPYGYANPMSDTSGVRRMVSGFVKRDGGNGTANLATTGRSSLPTWAVAYQNRTSTALTGAQAGPAVNSTRPLGYYMEDYDYLGDAGRTLGADFDLNQYNVRFCVTPEFPAGTYAYFVTIDATGAAVFPYAVGPQYFGTTSGGMVNAINEPVAEYVRGGQASAIVVSATNAGGNVTVTWNSVEGGTYKIETSADAANWATIASAVTSDGGLTTTYVTSTVAENYRVTLSALALYDTRGTGGLSGVGTSATASATVGTSGTARLVNIATRVQVGGAAGAPISGFVLGGTGTKRMLVRAVGPTLGSFGVSGALGDPSVMLVSGTTTIAGNDDWISSDATAMVASGAFALTPGSRDAAVVRAIASGAYSAPLDGKGGSGVALLEVYDARSSVEGPVLVNASTRAFVGTGEQVLIPGFVVSGTGSLRVLLRAVGPTLANFGVTGVLSDPQLSLYRGTTLLATNDNWGSATNAAEIASATAQSGAFVLGGGSRDAALIATLEAGPYTAIVSGVGNSTGTALVEVYVLQ